MYSISAISEFFRKGDVMRKFAAVLLIFAGLIVSQAVAEELDVKINAEIGSVEVDI